MSQGGERTVWILADQLSVTNAALTSATKGRDCLLFIESRQTFGKLPYHRHRLMLLLSAMRHYAAEREAEGWRVEYHRLADAPDMCSVLAGHCRERKPSEILVTEPNNHDERLALNSLAKSLDCPLRIIRREQSKLLAREFRARRSSWLLGSVTWISEGFRSRQCPASTERMSGASGSL